MRIAILGTRGVPARYGGFETLAEELSARLSARGHDVTVYTRTRYAEAGLSSHRGARIRVLPTIATKYLDTVVHGWLSRTAGEGAKPWHRRGKLETTSRSACL